MPNIATNIIIQAIEHVFTTMSSLVPVIGEPYIKNNDFASGEMTAIVTMETNKSINKKALVSLSMNKDVAKAIAQNILGELEDDDIDSRDMLGEIMNIISGHTRSLLITQTQDLHLKGSTPCVICGEPNTIHCNFDKQSIAIPFELAGGKCILEHNLENFF